MRIPSVTELERTANGGSQQRMVRREYDAAKKRPCGTCKWFKAGYCSSIQDNVKAWWTGCIRHSPNK